MEKITVKTQEFVAFDPWGTPRILSRSGSFVKPVEETEADSQPSTLPSAAVVGAKSGRPAGNSQYFGGFQQFRDRLLAAK